MNEKAIEARRAYRRKWAKENPDKVRAAQERYWLKQAMKRETKRAASEAEDAQPAGE